MHKQKENINFAKKILVTGGTGFLGSYLLRYLLQLGYHNIWALHRSSSDLSWIEDIKNQINWIECDVLDIVGLEDALQEVEEVYHSAAFISFLRSDRKKMLQINVEGTANLVDTALHNGVKRFLNVSSVAALGRTKTIEKLNEKNQWERSPFNTYYGLSKYLAEQEAWRAHAEGLQVIMVNPSMILGSYHWEIGTANFFNLIDKRLRFYPIGANGFVDVRDVVRIMVQLMESDIDGERFITSATTQTYQQLFTKIAQKLDTEAPKIKVNAFLRQLAWRSAFLQSIISGKKAIITRETIAQSSRSYTYENHKSIQELSFQYTPLEQTIDEIAAEFLKSKNKQPWGALSFE